MPSLQSLPKELLLNIISFLTDEPIAIGRLERSGRRLYQFIALNPDLWRDVCLKYFFCFYWEGTCKSLECNSCSKISFKNPFHQPKGTTFRQQFQTVYNGKYTGIVHVLNSLSNREMSAFMALATFDKVPESLEGTNMTWFDRRRKSTCCRIQSMQLLITDMDKCISCKIIQNWFMRNLHPTLPNFEEYHLI